MAFVLDGSVALAWAFADETSRYTEAVFDLLRDGGAIVPTIWSLEVANGLLVGERRQRLIRADVERFAQTLRSLPITIEAGDVQSALGPVLALARAQNLSTYDASYLELAARQNLPLATLDLRLREAAARIGVPLVEEPAG